MQIPPSPPPEEVTALHPRAEAVGLAGPIAVSRERTHDEGHKQNFFRSQYYHTNEEMSMQVYFHHPHTPQNGSTAVDYLEFVYVYHSILPVNLWPTLWVPVHTET